MSDRGSGSATRRWETDQVLAVAFLGLGAVVLPIVGPLIGVALVWASPRWTRRDKAVALIGGLVVPIVAVVVLLAMFSGENFALGPAPAAPSAVTR